MGPSVDMAVWSLVNQGYIWYFDLALPIIRTKIIDIVKNVSGLLASTRQSVSLWAGSFMVGGSTRQLVVCAKFETSCDIAKFADKI
jgi:hypothetical protein